MISYPKTKIALKTCDDKNIFYNPEKIRRVCDQTELFLDGIEFINSINFTRRVLFPYEVQFNNAIEGYNDDIERIMDIINFPNDEAMKSQEDYYRLRNLIVGYEYILKHRDINENSLKKLYTILSLNLLEPEDIISGKDLYRREEVYIFCSDRVDVAPDQGVPPSVVYPCMEKLFEYINTEDKGQTQIEAYIKSQIIHYYFVYVHPYYDINGRTSRTLSLWYLINSQAYPFTIFNRSIPHTRHTYYRVIKEAKAFRNLTFFLTYMLESIQREIEREYVINGINSVCGELSLLERQTLQYIFECKLSTILNFSTLYNRFNKPQKVKNIYENMFLSLIEKGIIIPGRRTNKNMFDNIPNQFYSLNPSILDDNNGKIDIKKYTLEK